MQDGKAVLVEGMKGFDGKTFSQYAKVNPYQNRIDYYNENPDRNRQASQRNVVAEAQKDKTAEKQDNKRARSRGVSQ